GPGTLDLRRVTRRIQDDNLFGVAEDGDVRVVGRDDELSLLLRIPEPPDDVLVDESVVEVVLRLIDDERVVVVQEQQEQDRRALLAYGQVFQGLVLGSAWRADVELDRDGVRQVVRLEDEAL